MDQPEGIRNPEKRNPPGDCIVAAKRSSSSIWYIDIEPRRPGPGIAMVRQPHIIKANKCQVVFLGAGETDSN